MTSVRTPESANALGADDVHVWTVSLDDAPEPFRNVLSAEEIERAGRFRFEKGRTQFAATRSALRILLGRYLQRDPAELRFIFSAKGKPSLDGERVRFNVAHSGGLALIALTLDREIGVDIEHMERAVKIDDTARAVLSAEELIVWQALDPAGRRASFFKHWVAKEAWLKALGVGLGRDPRTLEIAMLPVTELAVPDDYSAAVAVLGEGEVTVHQSAFS